MAVLDQPRKLLFEQCLVALQVASRDLGEHRDITTLRVIDPLNPDPVLDDAADMESWLVGEPPRRAPILIVVNGSTHRCDVDDSFVQILFDFASLIQDTIIDLTGKPWPQVTVMGRECVLDVMLDHGEVVWVAGGTPYCRVGELLNPPSIRS